MSKRKSTKVERICTECNKPYFRTPTYFAKYGVRFCSQACKNGLTIFSRFWRNIDRSNNDGCWTCKTTDGTEGYGKINAAGKMWVAHRLSWAIHNGPIPDGLFVCHKCDNPPCVRPDHLFLGTQKDNMADRNAKGRANIKRGEEAHNAKLTDEDVIKIFELSRLGYSSPKITMIVGKVSARHIRSILKGVEWKHIRQKLAPLHQTATPTRSRVSPTDGVNGKAELTTTRPLLLVNEDTTPRDTPPALEPVLNTTEADLRQLSGNPLPVRSMAN